MIKSIIKYYLVFIFSVATVLGSSKYTSEEDLLIEYKKEIVQAANQVGISPRVLASIIYAEHKLNVKLGENILDYVFAKSGYNSSMGIAQVKIGTAFWIERQVNDPQGQFYLGKNVELKMPYSNGWDEIVERLNTPEINILYASCYIAMISKEWEPVLELIDSGNNKVGIIATIYSLGILDSDSKIRKPHLDAKANNFGKTAQEFYNSFSLRNEFN